MPRLEQLKERLIQLEGPNGFVDLIPAMGVDNNLGEKFRQLSRVTELLIKKDSITYIPQSPPNEATLAEILIESEPQLLFNFQKAVLKMTISSSAEDVLQAKVEVLQLLESSLPLKGMPWISISKEKLTIQLSEDEDIQALREISIPVGSREIRLEASLTSLEEAQQMYKAIPSELAMAVAYLRSFAGGMDPTWWLPAAMFQSELLVTELSIDYNREVGKLLNVKAVFSTSQPLKLVGDRLQIQNFRISMEVLNPADDAAASYLIEGDIMADSIVMKVTGTSDATDQGITLTAKLETGQTLPLAKLGEWFGIDLSGLALGQEQLVLNELELNVQLNSATSYVVNGKFVSLTNGPVGMSISLDSLIITGNDTRADMELKASAYLNNERLLDLSGRLATNGRWKSCGKLGSNELSNFLGKLGNLLPSTMIPSDQLKFIDNGQVCFIPDPSGSQWVISAGCSWNIAPLKLDIHADLNVTFANNVWSGDISGSVNFHGIGLSFTYKDGKSILTWNGLAAEILDHTVTLKLDENFTVGKLVETAVSWVKGISFGLYYPWDALNSIKLPAASLSFDFTKEQVEFTAELSESMGFDLGLLKHISLVYDAASTAASRLMLKLELLGDLAKLSGPLEWDPSEPSQAPRPLELGRSVFDLKLLALGQHLSLNGGKPFAGIDKAFELLNDLKDIENPLQQPTRISVDSEAGWLIGSEFGILPSGSEYFIAMKILFHDPYLYGLKLTMDGPLAEFLNGLEFEITYQKITDSIGLYQAEIVLPDSMRTWEFGAYTVTLPSFGLGLYTNGDFKIDIGFPWQMDFSRSLTIQTIIPPGIPAIGSAGFYFNKLSGATSTRVPQQVTGEFKPVLEFGFGLRLGIGKEIQKGPLKAGFSVTVIGILEGVFAYWHPEEQSGKPAAYYWLQGTVGIQGKLYGSVDLSLVKADVDVTVTLAAQLTYEAYSDMEISIIAEVDINVKVKIGRGRFKIKIRLSYSARIKETFKIEASGKAPWEPAALLMEAANDQESCPCTDQLSPLRMNWKHMIPEFNGSGDTDRGQATELVVYVTPVLSASRQAGLTDNQTEGLHPVYVLLLALRTVGERKADEPEPTVLSDFEKLCQQYFRWLLAAAEPENRSIDEVDKLPVNKDIWCWIKQYFTCQRHGEQGWTPLPSSAIFSFMNAFFRLKLTEPLENSVEDTAFFPMVPDLQLKITHDDQNDKLYEKSYQFSKVAMADEPYLIALAEQFEELVAQIREEMNETPSAASLASRAEPISVAEFVFNDYFVLMAQQLVEAALDITEEEESFVYKHPHSATEAVQDIVQAVRSYTGNKEYTLTDLFKAADDLPLTEGATLQIDKPIHRTQDGETIQKIAEAYLKAVLPEQLAQAIAADQQLSQDTAALRAGVTIVNGAVPNDPGKLLVAGEDSLQSLMVHFNFTTVEQLLISIQIPFREGLELPLPLFGYSVRAADFLNGRATLGNIREKFGIKLEALANTPGNELILGLFAAGEGEPKLLEIRGLNTLSADVLFEKIRNKSGLRNISGMVSRFFLHGLRLPDQGLCLRQEDSECIRVEPDQVQGNRGLFMLTGQQFDIPDFKDVLTMSLDNPDNIGWVLTEQEEA